jgi:hypothetical protein
MFRMVLRIIHSVNVAGLVDALNTSPTRAANLMHKIYYFLSLITDTNDNYRLNNNNGGYHNLCSCELKKVLGSKDFYIIRELLLNPDDPIIEVDNSWHNPNGAKSSGYCQGYRITHKYNTGEVVFKTIPKKLSKVISKYTDKDTSAADAAPDYKFLLEQFESNTLSFDPKVYKFISNFSQQLLVRIQNNNPYQIKLVHNLIGRWIYYIKQIEDYKSWCKVSPKNHRLNSSITNLPRLLRPFLLFNGESLTCVDVTSSQPYLLSSIMQAKFYNESRVGYNLKTIYPELYRELIENGSIDTSNTGIGYYSSNTGYTNSFISNLSNSSSFMWCNFFTAPDIDSITNYTQAPFYLDFYTDLLNRYYTYNNIPKRVAQKEDREKLKGTMMFVLFDENKGHRNNNLQIQMFQSVYPGVEKWLNQIHTLIGKKRFSYLLQRAESYLLLNVICKEFIEQHPTAPLITIHDGIFTTKEYVRNLNGFVLRRLREITGIIAGCKIKASQIETKPQIQDIENEWAKIEPINTEEKYLKNNDRVLKSNIDIGSKFLKNFSAIFIFVFSINCHFPENFGKYFGNKSVLLKEFKGRQEGIAGYLYYPPPGGAILHP